MSRETITIRAREFGEIQRRVGIEPSERLDWALQRLVAAAPAWEILTPIEWRTLRLETCAFLNALVWWNKVPKVHADALRPKFGRPGADSAIRFGTPEVPAAIPSQKEVKEINAHLLAILVELHVAGRVSRKFDRVIRMETLGRSSLPVPRKLGDWEKHLGSDRLWWMYPCRSNDLPAQAEQRAVALFFDLLDGTPPYLVRSCPEHKYHQQHGGGFFVATRTNKVFCSDLCQERDAVRRSRRLSRKATTSRADANHCHHL